MRRLGLRMLLVTPPTALWETTWPAHANKGPYCKHELYTVWVCVVAKKSCDISVMVHGEQQYTWIPTKGSLMSSDRRRGHLNHVQRPQSEFCKFVVDCFKHERAAAQHSYTIPLQAACSPQARVSAQHEHPGTVASKVFGARVSAAAAARDCKDAGNGVGGGEGDDEGAAVHDGSGCGSLGEEDELDDSEDDGREGLGREEETENGA
jgi:hypothetical protein